MSEIVKTETIVLSKMDYGDTSIIASLFTEDYGRLNVIVKGARSSKSKYGRIIDPINHLSVVLYNKVSRDLQLLSSADIIDHYPFVKEDLGRLKYAYSSIELVKKLLAEHEVNKKIFKGSVRILSRLNSAEEIPEITFGRFFFFFLKEIGYEIQIGYCSVCG
ncbi:MAG: DNA repair protein RecO, partial [Ignavibacteriales bacterium]